MFMGVLGWIVMGLIAGYVASRQVSKSGAGLRFDIGLGILGGVLGGWLFNTTSAAGATSFNVWSLMAAVVGAVVLLVIWHSIKRTAWHA